MENMLSLEEWLMDLTYWKRLKAMEQAQEKQKPSLLLLTVDNSEKVEEYDELKWIEFHKSLS